MNRPQAVFLAIAIALSVLFALSLFASAGVDAAPAQAAVALHPVAGPGSGMAGQANPLSASAVITCSVTTTTTDEINNTNFDFASAAVLATYNNLSLLASSPAYPGQVATRVDYFRLDNATSGFKYTVDAIPNGTGNYNLGILVYDKNFTQVYSDTNTLDGVSARIEFQAVAGAAPYYFVVTQISASCSGGTYKLIPAYTGPTATPTATPTNTPQPFATATPVPGADRFEPNFDFDRAGLIALGVKYPNLSFVPWAGADPYSRDDDWFKVWVKPGLLVTCETLDLGPGVDTNLIMYDNNRNSIGGNDDIDRAAGNFASRLSYYVTYLGYLYLDIGQPFAVDPNQVGGFTYSVQCMTGSGPTPTPTATRPTSTPAPVVPTNTPIPTLAPTDTPAPTSTPPFIQVRQLPTVTPAGQASVLIPISLQVYYDLNNNRQPDPGEGVVGVSVHVTDVTTGQALLRAFTDEFGFASLTASAPGVVRLSVPYLNYSVVVQPSGAAISLRIAPHDLPKSIP